MRTFPRLDILPPVQRELWSRLVVVRNEAFVLYGGTAIALALGHRESIDFDFFSSKPFQPEMLLERFSFLTGAEVLQSQPNTLTVLARGGKDSDEPIKVSFFGGLRFGRLAEPQQTPDGVMEVASLPDLLAHKLKVLLQRVEAKDYLDIDALLQSGMDLANGLSGAQALFPVITYQECLKALTYFEDAALKELPSAVKGRLVEAARNVRAVPHSVIKARTLTGNHP